MALTVALLAPVLLGLTLVGCDAATEGAAVDTATGTAEVPDGPWARPDLPGRAEVVVMTQNLYLGANIFQLLAPECEGTEANPLALPLCVDRVYGEVVASDFAARAEFIADRIAQVQPALLGLQEVSTYYVQEPGDFLTGANTVPGEDDLTIDFLAILLDALDARGLAYAPVSVSPNSDVELPAFDGAAFYDVRYQDADVVLALDDPKVETGATTEQPFSVLLTLDIDGIPQTFVRGYQTVEAEVDGYAFTFVNTHLEVGGDAGPVQEAQAAELKAAVDAIGDPVMLVGDLNSEADGSGTASYALLQESLDDVFDRRYLRAEPTCCQAPDLVNTSSLLNKRIDYVLYEEADRVVLARTFLNNPRSRVESEGRLIWPSDHAGVAALFVYDLTRSLAARSETNS